MIEKYPLPLALESILPVILAAIGLFLIARILKRKNEIVGELAHIGATLIVAGQSLPALWRLLRAANGADFYWLNNASLVLIAPGSICLAWALWRGFRGIASKATAGSVWLMPLFLNAGFMAVTAASRVILGGRVWFTILFTLAALAGIAIFLQLTLRAIHHRLSFAALLFLFSLAMSLMLPRLIGNGAESLAAEWTRQISNTISQGAFAFAAFQLSRKES